MIRRINTRRSGFLRSALLLGAGAVMISMAVATSAQQSQSPAQLRRENDTLRERIIELEAEIAQANTRIRTLNDQLAKTRAQLDRPATSDKNPNKPSPPQHLPGKVPDDRFSCPAALRNWLMDDYVRQFEGNTKPSQRQLDQWERRAALERATVVWDVRMLGWKEGRINTALVRVFERETDEDLCFPFPLPLTQHEADQLRNNPEQLNWTIEGVLAATTSIPEATVPDETDNPGKIDNPGGNEPRTGMGFEFGWTLSIRSLEPFNPDDSDRGAGR